MKLSLVILIIIIYTLCLNVKSQKFPNKINSFDVSYFGFGNLFFGEISNTYFGDEVSPAGDVDGDKIDDFIINSFNAKSINGNLNSGQIFIIYGLFFIILEFV
jgi:hypothetical protein